MCMVDQLPCGSVLTPAISCTKFKIHSAHADTPLARHCFVFFNFEGGPVSASQTKKLRKRMCMVDQLPCGSVFSPAISCTKFKILSAHADSLLVETLFCYHQFWDDYSMLCRNSINRNIVSFSSVSRKDQSLLHRPRNSGRECACWTSSVVGQYFHQLSLVQSSRSIQRMQTVH